LATLGVAFPAHRLIEQGGRAVAARIEGGRVASPWQDAMGRIGDTQRRFSGLRRRWLTPSMPAPSARRALKRSAAAVRAAHRALSRYAAGSGRSAGVRARERRRAGAGFARGAECSRTEAMTTGQ
jgi:hypothetical protein